MGDQNGLRGHRQQRFSGKAVLYQNNDLRLKLFTASRFVIPFTLGLTVGADIGRVWIDEEDSARWHLGYGGGVWIAPLDLVIINLNYFISADDTRFTVGMGQAF